MTEKRINDIGMVFFGAIFYSKILKDGTLLTVKRKSRVLTNLSIDYDKIIMNMIMADLVDDGLHLKNLPIIPVKINEHTVNALIDTGAEYTCINIVKALEFGLKKNGNNIELRTISDKESTLTTGFDAKFNWVTKRVAPGIGFLQSFCGINFPKRRNKYDVIIGRDILKKVVLTYDGKIGKVIIKWG
jgi:hypothetical protein